MNGEIICFSCLKLGHTSRNYRTRAPTQKYGDEKVEKKKTWIEIVRNGSSGARKDEITQSNGSGDDIASK